MRQEEEARFSPEPTDTMSEESQPQRKTLAESEQLPTPPSSPQQVDEEAGKGDEESGDGGREEAEKPQDEAAPLTSLSDVAVSQFPEPSHTPVPRKGSGRRKKSNVTPKKRAAADQRLAVLNVNFHPVPFFPDKILDFSQHEQLFRVLGLWDFVHLELDREVRADLLVQLIAYYDQSNRRSYVHGVRISVSRSDLARALSLPVKKEKANPFEDNASIQEFVSSDEVSGVFLDFISNCMPMPYGDDMCILPPEFMKATQLVKEGQLHKVDWAALMWVLVEKELLEAPKSGVCHCASHMQRLIKNQQPKLFSEESKPVLETILELEEEELSVADAEANVAEEEVDPDEEDDDASDNDGMKMRSLEDLGNAGQEKDNVELGLTLGDEENLMDGLEDCRVGDNNQWPDEGKNQGFEHCLRRCDPKASEDFENLAVEERQEVKYGDDISGKFLNLERLSSSDLLQAMETSNIPYTEQLNALDPSSGEYLTMGADSQKDVMLDHGPNGSMYSGNNGKRQSSEIGDEEEDQFEHNNQQKRLRSCEPWGDMPLSFVECMEHMQGYMGRAKILFAEKDQAMMNMQMQMQYLNHMLQDKDQVIRSLKMMMEEQQHWQLTVRHYQHELSLMTQMLIGYRKALKQTRSRFADYRKKHPHHDESLYKDVPGTGGLVLSEREFEKLRLEKEQGTRQELLSTYCNIEMKFKEFEDTITLWNGKLVDLAGDMNQLKDRFAKSNCSST